MGWNGVNRWAQMAQLARADGGRGHGRKGIWGWEREGKGGGNGSSSGHMGAWEHDSMGGQTGARRERGREPREATAAMGNWANRANGAVLGMENSAWIGGNGRIMKSAATRLDSQE